MSNSLYQKFMGIVWIKVSWCKIITSAFMILHQQGDSSRKSMQAAVINGQHCLIYLLIGGQCKNRSFFVI